MSPKDFEARSPGKLVPVVFEEPPIGRTGTARGIKGFAFVPQPLPPKFDRGALVAELYEELATAQEHLARLDGASRGLSNARVLWAPLGRREAVLSSRIEDTIASPEEVALFEAGADPGREEVREVFNYVKALLHGVRSDLPICLRLMKEMHGVLLQGVRGARDRPGEFRIIQNYIGNRESGFSRARFVPPPPGADMERCLQDLEMFINTYDRRAIPPLVAAALVHYQFECIHPFRDGNGRIGRLISALQLSRDHLGGRPYVYLSGYFEAHREEYCRCLLEVSTKGEWIGWIRCFLRAAASQAADAFSRLRKLQAIRRRYRQSLVDMNAPARTLLLADKLIEFPVMTAARAAKLAGVEKPTARSYIRKLVEIGALRLIDDGYRQCWLAQEIIDLEGADDPDQPKS